MYNKKLIHIIIVIIVVVVLSQIKYNIHTY